MRQILLLLTFAASLTSAYSQQQQSNEVIAEGAAYGCIPLVTNISSIEQYIQNGINGFLLKDNHSITIADTLDKISSNLNLKRISGKATELGTLFTYEYYKERIVKEIL